MIGFSEVGEAIAVGVAVGDDFGVNGMLVGVGVQVGGKRPAAKVVWTVKEIAGDLPVAGESFPARFENITAAVPKIKQFNPSTKSKIVSCLEVRPKNRRVRLAGGISISPIGFYQKQCAALDHLHDTLTILRESDG